MSATEDTSSDLNLGKDERTLAFDAVNSVIEALYEELSSEPGVPLPEADHANWSHYVATLPVNAPSRPLLEEHAALRTASHLLTETDYTPRSEHLSATFEAKFADLDPIRQREVAGSMYNALKYANKQILYDPCYQSLITKLEQRMGALWAPFPATSASGRGTRDVSTIERPAAEIERLLRGMSGGSGDGMSRTPESILSWEPPTES